MKCVLSSLAGHHQECDRLPSDDIVGETNSIPHFIGQVSSVGSISTIILILYSANITWANYFADC